MGTISAQACAVALAKQAGWRFHIGGIWGCNFGWNVDFNPFQIHISAKFAARFWMNCGLNLIWMISNPFQWMEILTLKSISIHFEINFKSILVGGLDHFLFFHILWIIIPTSSCFFRRVQRCSNHQPAFNPLSNPCQRLSNPFRIHFKSIEISGWTPGFVGSVGCGPSGLRAATSWWQRRPPQSKPRCQARGMMGDFRINHGEFRWRISEVDFEVIFKLSNSHISVS